MFPQIPAIGIIIFSIIHSRVSIVPKKSIIVFISTKDTTFLLAFYMRVHLFSLHTAVCPIASNLIPSCGVVGCTDDLCGVGALTPIGSLGFSIWSNDCNQLDFPICFSLTGLHLIFF